MYYVFQQVLDGTEVPGGAMKIITDRDGGMLGMTATILSELPEEDAGESEDLILPEEAEEGKNPEDFFARMEPVPYTGCVDWSDGTEKEISVSLMRDTETGIYCLGSLEHRILVADCWEFLYNGGNIVPETNEDNREWDQVGLMSLYNYCRAYDYFRAAGWEGTDGRRTPILILKDFCDEDHRPVDNAAYAGKAYGWECFLSSSANDLCQCLDVAAHEFAHGVTDAVTTYNSYENDCGAINEALSDIHGNLCEMLAGDTEDDSWTLGEHSLEAFRSMSKPHLYGQPEYTWDLYYDEGVRDATDINDRGGVHTNSSLLNRTAWLLCEGGMSLGEARDYWFAVGCAMAPGTDYPQMRALLPFVLKITGMEKYRDALSAALEATRMGETGILAAAAEEYGHLELKLPDNEVFNNGKWILNTVTVDLEGLCELARGMMDEWINGSEAAGTQIPAAFFSGEETDGAQEDEARAWLWETLAQFFHLGDAAAGGDGHTIRMSTTEGRLIPVLMYMDLLPNSDRVSQMKIAAWIGSRWVDLSPILAFVTGAREVHFTDVVEGVLDSGLLGGLAELVLSCDTAEDYGNALTFRMRKGETVELPATGLERITLESNMANPDADAGEEIEVNSRKSRPRED